MAKFLIRNFSDPKGYTEVTYPSASLPRTPTESYVPWAITPVVGRVVYAKTGEHHSFRGGGNSSWCTLKPYDTLVSQNRRMLAESELGLYALNNAASLDAVRTVSNAIKVYLNRQFWENQAKAKATVFDQIGHYFYTAGGKGFGRISEGTKAGVGVDGVWTNIFATLEQGRLDQVMAIHDAIGRKVLPVLGGPQLAIYEKWGPVLRQNWFDDRNKRGRADAPQKAAATTAGGIATARSGQVGTVAQSRVRGVDSFRRDEKRTREPAADVYYDDLDDRNLLFGAGISGTTGSLLQAAFAFSNPHGDALRQYVLGIVGYLVGGGMHSYHESMAVAQKAGVAYTPGLYVPSLPQNFQMTPFFRTWSEKYYDIVQLGATHWRHSAAHLPSHLNTNLRLPAPR